jgi:hypothetical protein
MSTALELRTKMEQAQKFYAGLQWNAHQLAALKSQIIIDDPGVPYVVPPDYDLIFGRALRSCGHTAADYYDSLHPSEQSRFRQRMQRKCKPGRKGYERRLQVIQAMRDEITLAKVTQKLENT